MDRNEGGIFNTPSPSSLNELEELTMWEARVRANHNEGEIVTTILDANVSLSPKSERFGMSNNKFIISFWRLQ